MDELAKMQLERMKPYLSHHGIKSPKKVKGETYWMGLFPDGTQQVIPSIAYKPPYPGEQS